MLKNYIKIALRSILKYKGYSFINVTGLAIGMTCCILIFLWVQDELNYDRFHKNANELYRVIVEQSFSEGKTLRSASTPPPLAPALKKKYPGIVNSTRFTACSLPVKYGIKVFNENGFGFADPSIFDMFTFLFVIGNPAVAFPNPNSIILTESISKKYFGDMNPIGKTLKVSNQLDFTVTGIIKDIPLNSHIQFDFLVPFTLLKGFRKNFDSWGDMSYRTYVQLQKNISVLELSEKISGIIKSYEPEWNVRANLQQLTKIHLHDLSGGGLIIYVYIFSIIAIFVLFIACINFMNMTTAQAGNRAREVGMRKAVGAQKRDIIKQFYSESVLLSFLAFFFAIILVSVLLPAFNDLSGKQLSIDLLRNINIIFGLIIIAIFTGVISGSYPALFLSSFQPVKVLKGSLKSGSKGSVFRKVLVVTQFSISIFMIICTIVVYSQLEYIKNKKLGYDKEHMVYIPMIGEIGEKYGVMRDELLQNPDVLSAAAASSLPTHIATQSTGVDWEGKNPGQKVLIPWVSVDYDYIETLDLEILEGRKFSKDISTDSVEGYIVNEKAIELMGMLSPVGKRFSNWGKIGKIIGVVKNFHFESIHNKIKPLLLMIRPKSFNYIIVKINSDNISSAIGHLRNTWKKFAPGIPFEYGFLDETIGSLYVSEKRMGKIFKYFAFLAIFISSLGLIGLTSHTVRQRTKEIGIRKVLGSSVSALTLLLSKEFTKWVILANVIAWPAAYFAMNKWLESFAYRTSITIGIFVLSGLIALVIALLTVSYQSIKAANANPVEALKYE